MTIDTDGVGREAEVEEVTGGGAGVVGQTRVAALLASLSRVWCDKSRTTTLAYELTASARGLEADIPDGAGGHTRVTEEARVGTVHTALSIRLSNPPKGVALAGVLTTDSRPGRGRHALVTGVAGFVARVVETRVSAACT